MATEKLVQNSFVNGQYDREVQSKERTDFIGQGLAKALNVVSGEKGELRKRLGTRFIKNLDGASVLIPFRKPNGDDIVLVCTDGNVKGYEFKNNELVDFVVPSGVAPTFPDTGWTTNTNGDYTVALEGSTDYNGFNSGSYSTYSYIPSGAGYTTYIQIESTNAQLLSELTVVWMLDSITTASIIYGHYKGWINPVIQYSDDGINWFSVLTQISDPYTGTVGQEGYKFETGTSWKFKWSQGYVGMNIINEGETSPHKYWRIAFANSINNTTVRGSETLYLSVSNVIYSPSNTTSFSASNSFFNGQKLKNIKYSQHYTQMVMTCVGESPIQLDYSANGLTLTSFSGLPVGYEKPTSVHFFQQRLWFGGFDAYPTTILASKIDNYTTFTEQSPVQFDDYLNLKCNQLRTQITNIIGGQKVLYTFSEDGLALVDAGTNGMIATNQSIEFNLRNRMPSGDATPAYKDDVMLYGSSDGTKLYAVDYDLMTERFQVDDLAKYAKDITFDKITELHYVNDESKQIYGLLESGNMFALNYKKSAYQGFFPFNIQDGYVYDIVQIKVGRNYKLLLVTCRNGVWYIEEMPDKGQYLDTTAPMMTKEDKKWATYDNINNNIALDCYQKYSETVELDATLDYDNLTLTTNTDLTEYIGSQVMLGRLNDDSRWVILTIDSTDLVNVYNVTIDAQRGDSTTFDILYKSFNKIPVSYPVGTKIGVVAQGQYFGEFNVPSPEVLKTLYCWENSNNDVVFTTSETPNVGDQLYDADGNEITSYYQNTVAAYDSINDEITVNETSLTSEQFARTSNKDLIFSASLVNLPKSVFKATYGILYGAHAFIKVERPYESMKTVRQINLQVQNTMHLSVGTGLEHMQVLEDINDNTHYDLTNMTMNGSYVIVPSDTPEWSKYIILESDKGLPFTVNAVEVIMNYSNIGGN